jgi:hypothetical protein
MNLLALVAPFLLLFGGGARFGVVAPGTGADRGAQGTVVVPGYTGTEPLANVSLTFDSRRERRWQIEQYATPFPRIAVVDFARGNRHSVVKFTIPGTSFEENYLIEWPTQSFLLGPADGVIDFAGTGGGVFLLAQSKRETRLITTNLEHFIGDTITLQWSYTGKSSAMGGGFWFEVDEHLDPSRLTPRYNVAVP